MTPTDAQISTIGRIADEYMANKRHFSEDSEVCSIAILYNKEDPSDKTITVVTNTIYKYNKDNRPLTMLVNTSILPDGTAIDMDEFATKEEQAKKVAKLTKLQMNQ
jgi:hypothetical protein